MASLRFQFHADESELLALADEWSSESRLAVVVEQFFPSYRPVVVERGIAEAVSQLERVDRVCLDTAPFDVSATSAHEFVTRNMGCLVMSMGQLTDEGLRESALSAGGGLPDKMDLWRRLR